MRRGESGAEIIIFGALFVAAIISVLWAVQKISPIQIEIQRVNEDVEQLSLIFSDACNSYAYSKRYETKTHTGNLIVNDNSYCINNTRIELCSPTICDVGIHMVSLNDIRYVIVSKEQTGGGESYNVRSE